MALADLAAFKAALSEPREGVSLGFGSSAAVAANGRMVDMWVSQVPAGTAPTTAVVPDRTTAGALGQQNGAGTLGIIGARLNTSQMATYWIVDRLSHSGGLSGTVTTAQTTNLPTAALTRYTSGVGVMMALTIYTQIGTTTTTVSASYTNQAGTSGRTSPLVVFGGTSFREASRMILLPLVSGDTGVRSVESVTVTATTGTAGAFGVTLFKPLCAIAAMNQEGIVAGDFLSGGLLGGLPEIVTDACLHPIGMTTGTSQAGAGAILTTEW